jgi:hypothetical protein
VAEHNALGPAGGAAGVEDGGQVVTAAPGVLDRFVAADELLEGFGARGGGAVAGVDDVLELLVGGPDAYDVAGEGVVDDEDAGIDLGKGLGDLREAPAQVDRDDDAAGPQRGAEELVVAIGVQGEDRGALAVPDAEVLKRAGEAGDAIDGLPVGPGAARTDGGDGVRPLLDGAVESLGEVQGGLSVCCRSPQRLRGGGARGWGAWSDAGRGSADGGVGRLVEGWARGC